MSSFPELEITASYGRRTYYDIETMFASLDKETVQAVERASVPVSRALRDMLKRVATTLETYHSSPWNGGVVNDKNTLQRRSGEGLASIRRSITVMGSGSLNTIYGIISAAKLSVHETGATIRARRAKYLTIPLPAAMDGRGVPLRRRARDWDNTFVTRTRRGNLIIFQRKGRNKITPLYLLKPSVYIRPRLGMQAVVDGHLPYFEARAVAAMERAILKGFDA